jgi:hypothetical protein
MGSRGGLVDRWASAPARHSLSLPDGTTLRSGPQAPAFTLRFGSDAALLALVTRGHIGLLESYFDQQIDVDGDFGVALAAGMNTGFDRRTNALAGVENNLHEWRFSNRTPGQAKLNARAHSGLGFEFYRRWLDDPLMMYTCAYWPEGTRTLEQAQCNKIDHVCRKLRLAPGERFATSAAASEVQVTCARTVGAAAPEHHHRQVSGCSARSRGVAWPIAWPCARATFATSTGLMTRWCRSACSNTPAATSWPR